jgi:hypothetical protein
MRIRNLSSRKTHVVGIRLSDSDLAKLNTLVETTQRQASDVVRLLIRAAQPVDAQPFVLTSPRQEVALVAER